MTCDCHEVKTEMATQLNAECGKPLQVPMQPCPGIPVVQTLSYLTLSCQTLSSLTLSGLTLSKQTLSMHT